MKKSIAKEIKVKSVTKQDRLIKIYGIEKQKIIELSQLEKIFQNSSSQDIKFEPDQVYIVELRNGYERCLLLDADYLSQSADVYLIDIECGREAKVLLSQLRPIAPTLSSPQSYCNEYILAEIYLSTETYFFTDWKDLQALLYNDEFLKIDILKIVCDQNICRILSADISAKLKPSKHGFIRSIELEDQLDMISDYAEKAERKKLSQQQMNPIARNLKAPAPPRFKQENESDEYTNTQLTFKSNALAYNSVHQVRVTHLEKGIHLFYVQLVSLDSQLQALMSKIQNSPLRTLRERPTALGMACLAKHNKKIYRVAIGKSTSEAKNNDMYLCHFVDFGYSSLIEFGKLYYIPTELIAVSAYAISFCLSGLKNTVLTANVSEVNYLFRQLTENKLLTLKCVQSKGPPICQYCELFDDHKANILDELKRFNPVVLKFPPQSKLDQKYLNVKVCYAYSTNEFYVQKMDPKSTLDYDMLYYEIQQKTVKAPLSQLQVGACCGVLIDGEWFRAQVISVKPNKDAASVQIIDFGVIDEVSAKNIRLLTVNSFAAPPFAYRCCLKGFENLEVSENINTQFDIFCSDGQGERRVFKMLIEDFTFDKGYIVELEDESVSPPANVNRILLKNSRPLAETITLENAKKRQKEASIKKESTVVQVASQTAIKDAPKEEGSKEIKTSDRNRNSSQRGRSNHKGVQRSSPVNDKRQRTHFGNQNDKSQPGTYFNSPKEATTNEKPPVSAKLNTSNSSSSFELNWRDSPDNSKSKSKSKSPKTRDKKQQQRDTDKQKSPMKREKSTVDDKVVPKKAETPKNLKCGWVSTLCTVNKAYVHLEEHIEGLEMILNGMFTHYREKSGPSLKDVQKGLICAFISVDGNWYRGEILQVKNETCMVRNMEYGNVEKTDKTKIFELVDKYAKEDRFLSEVYFTIKPTESDESLLKEMQSLFKEGSEELKFEFITKFRNGHILEVLDLENQNFFDKLEAKKIAVRIDEKELSKLLDDQENVIEDLIEISPQATISETEVIPVIEIVENKGSNLIEGKITALTSPNDFYLTSLDSLSNFDKLQNDIQCFAPAMSPLLDFECGTLCLAQYPFDNLWYRAKIIDSDETIITVICIDNGKTFSIDNKISLKIHPEQLKHKSFGMSCSLPVTIERKCEEDATTFMLQFVDLSVNFEIVLATQQKNYVEVSINAENISDFLVKKNLAKRIEIVQSGKGYTSHINSLSDFYIQLERDQLKLDLISKIFDRTNGKFDKVNDPKVNQIVAAKFNDDECWYRSRIESIDEDGYMVKFIDYGNYSITKEIGVLEDSITELPELSKQCRLSKPKNLLNFSEAAEKKFLDICDSGATILEVIIAKPGEITEVELFCNGQNIIESLIPLCSLHDINDDY